MGNFGILLFRFNNWFILTILRENIQKIRPPGVFNPFPVCPYECDDSFKGNTLPSLYCTSGSREVTVSVLSFVTGGDFDNHVKKY
jgi:hypothetical protein